MGVTRMNEECLKLKDHTAGYQTVQDIQRVVTEAIGGRAALSNEQLIDEVMVRLPSCSMSQASLLRRASSAEVLPEHRSASACQSLCP